MTEINYGYILRDLRRKLSLSAHDLALKLGISEKSVFNFEHNKYSYSTYKGSRVRKILIAFIQNNQHEHHDTNNDTWIDEFSKISKKNDDLRLISRTFSKGKRYSVSDSGNAKPDADFMRPDTGKGCTFIYLRKDGKHHVFREASGGWIRTYTDFQLIGKNIQEI